MSNNIKKIFYINLNKRTDRRGEIETELNNFGLEYERFEAIETRGFGILGCGLSHLGVLKIAKERGYENVLILEDDFQFLVEKEEFEKQLNCFFEENINFDVCMISYNLIHYEDIGLKSVNKILEAQTASGYIVNNHYYDALINLYEDAMPKLQATRQHWNYANDQVWKPLQKKANWFYFKTRLGKQRGSYSDNTECYYDYNC
jgi:GR25 family glycosyltransferase involved in LPS biosynthesis